MNNISVSVNAHFFSSNFLVFKTKQNKKNTKYKQESLRTKHPQLRLEYQIYRSLQQSKYFVRVWGYVTHYNHQIMVCFSMFVCGSI